MPGKGWEIRIILPGLIGVWEPRVPGDRPDSFVLSFQWPVTGTLRQHGLVLVLALHLLANAHAPLKAVKKCT